MIRTIWTALCMAFMLVAQTPGGRWEGTIETPNGDLKIEVDLKNDADAGWIGTISIPEQKLAGFRLRDIKVKDNAVTFGMKIPGDPTFEGTLAKEGGKISGEMTQGGTTMPFSMNRTGEAKVEKPPRNAALSKELVGTWEGTLDAKGKQFRLRFVLSNQDGAGTAALFSLDQGNAEFPIERINVADTRVTLEVPIIHGKFSGDLKGKQLVGTWTQGPAEFPLTITKAGE